MKDITKLVASILICELAGLIGSIFTSASVSTWYLTLNKPIFNPPGWIFAPIWTILFLLMGIALYLVWINKSKLRKTAMILFFVQLGLNIIWSFLFFGLRSPIMALVEVIILWLAILITLLSFYKISKKAGYLLAPYLIWVSFACVLNFYIVILN